MSTKHAVHFDDYTKGHYIKKLVKKYNQKPWDVTELALRSFGENIEVMMGTDQVRLIHSKDHLSIHKVYFSVAGTKVGYTDSCCRAIIVTDSNKKLVTFLLVYHTTHLSGKGGETVQWERVIKDNFPEYALMI
jgi:hypothetical protein